MLRKTLIALAVLATMSVVASAPLLAQPDVTVPQTDPNYVTPIRCLECDRGNQNIPGSTDGVDAVQYDSMPLPTGKIPVCNIYVSPDDPYYSPTCSPIPG